MSTAIFPWPVPNQASLDQLKSGHNITSGDPREWGVDVGMAAGTPIVAPWDGVVSGYASSSTDWFPGRLLLSGGPSGETLGFGHVLPQVAPGTQVKAGQVIATVGRDTVDGWDHTEFMLFPTGNTSSHGNAADPRGYLTNLYIAFRAGMPAPAVGGVTYFGGNAYYGPPGATHEAGAASNPCRGITEIMGGMPGASIPLLGDVVKAGTAPVSFIIWAAQSCVRWKVGMVLLGGVLLVAGFLTVSKTARDTVQRVGKEAGRAATFA